MRVDYCDSLIRGQFKWRFQQTTVGIHYQCERLYLNASSVRHVCPDKYGKLKHDPLASASILGIGFGHELDLIGFTPLNLALATDCVYITECVINMCVIRT